MSEDRPHILVVDDVPDQADSLADLLEIWGYDAAARYDGETALAAVGRRLPAVVLVDIGMPRMDGFKFAAVFFAMPGCGSTPVVAVSGYETLRTRALEAGIAHYLVKPVDLSFLQTLLLQLVRAPSTRSPTMTVPPIRVRHGELCATG